MELIITPGAPVINTEAIAKGDLIRAKYAAWAEERNGQVAAVTRDEIRIIWQPNIRNVTNFFSIYAAELNDGLWTVKWSPDMETFNVYPVPEEPEPPEEPGPEPEPGESEGGDIGTTE